MIKPVNGHLLVEPVKHESFISSQKGTYEEIGIVKGVPLHENNIPDPDVEVGDKIYFDSWLIAKYPDGKDDEIWLVRWADVRAVEYAD